MDFIEAVKDLDLKELLKAKNKLDNYIKSLQEKETLSDKIMAFGFPSCNMESKDVKEALKNFMDILYKCEDMDDLKKARGVTAIELFGVTLMG